MLEKVKKQDGIALLELLVSISILLILAGIGIVNYGKVAVVNFENETSEKLVALTKAFCLYYDTYGSYASQITDLAPYCEKGNVSKDAWGNTIAYYTNIQVDGKNYPSAFISGGKDGNIDSTLDGSTLTLSSSDIYALTSQGMIESTRREKTEDKISRANAALSVYLSNPPVDSECQTDNSDECCSIMYGEGLVEGIDCYDNWGHLLLLDADTSTFYSVGPDGIGGNSDDVS